MPLSRLLDTFLRIPGMSEQDMYAEVLDLAIELTDSKVGFIHRISEDQNTIILTAWSAATHAGCSAEHDTHYPLEQAGNWADSVRLRRPVIYNDYASSPNRKGVPDGHMAVERFVSFPVIEEDLVRVVFGVGNKATDYTDSDVGWLRQIANEAEKMIRYRRAADASRASAERYRVLFDNSPAGIFRAAPDGRFLEVNPAFAKMLGYEHAETVVDEHRGMLEHLDVDALAETCPASSAPGESDLGPRVVRCRRRDGSEFVASVHLRTVREDGAGEIYVEGIAEDVTEQHRARKELERVNRVLRMLSDTNQALIRAIDEQTLLDEFCRIAVDIGGYVLAWVAFAENDERKTLRPVAHAGIDSGYIMDARPTWGDDERGRGPGGTAVRTGEPKIVRSIATDPAFHLWREAAMARGYKSVIALPLLSEVEVRGVIGIYAGDEDAFDTAEVAILRELAGDVSFGLATLRTRVLREQAESALRDSLEQTRLIAENTADTIVVTDMTGRPTYVSPSMFRLRGVTPGESLRETVAEVFVPASAAQVSRSFEEARAWQQRGEEWRSTLELEMLRKDGTTVWVEMTASLFKEDDGQPKGIVFIIRDITTRREAEQRLRESERKFRSLAESSPDNIILYDRHGHSQYINPNVFLTVGFMKPEHLGQPPVIRPEFPTLVTYGRMLQQVLETGERGELDVDIQSPAGEWRTHHVRFAPELDADGRVAGAIAIGRDITERKRLLENTQRLATAIEQAGETVMITDARGVVQYVNPAFARVTGYAREEIVGRNPRHIVAGKHQPRFYRDMLSELRAGQTWRGRLTNKRKDGALIEEEATITPVRNEKGEIDGYVAVERDVTQQILLETRIRQTQKMEAVGRLASGVAHDFNNVLQALKSQLDLVQSSTSAVAADVAELQNQVRRGASVTRQLLLFSRRGETARELFDLNVVVREGAGFLKRLLRENVELIVEMAPAPVWVVADRGQLDQVLMNLAINAADAMPSGGAVRIGVAATDGHGSFFVADSGSGIPEELREKIFDPFFTTKALGHGTGLGLSVVHGIVTNHGGRIAVDSRAGAGTTFHVLLPLVENPEPQPVRMQPAILGQMAAGCGERLLIVEDEETTRLALKRILDALGYRVTTAATAAEVDRLPDDPPFDVLLTDMLLPDAEGGALALKLRTRWPRMAVVLMSGYEGDAVRHSTELGAEFLQKPFDTPVLASMLRRALAAQAGAVVSS